MLLLIWPLIIIGGLIFLIKWRKGQNSAQTKEWYLRLSLSKEDALSQWFGLLAFLFLSLALFGFNRDVGGWLSWQTILLGVVLIGLMGAYWLKMRYVLILSLGGVFIWWAAQAVKWVQDQQIQGSSIVSGLVLIILWFFILGRWQAKREILKRFSLIYLVWSVVTISGCLFYFSTRAGLMTLHGITKGSSLLNAPPLALSWGVLLIGLCLVIIYGLNKKIVAWYEAVGVLVLAGLFAVITFLPEQTVFVNPSSNWRYFPLRNRLTNQGVMWAAIFNLITFFELLAVIFLGYVRREKWMIDLGAVFLFLLIIIKYFDWFFSFLDKSLFFIGAGILLFIVGWLIERGRRYVLAEINSQNN